MLRVCEWCGDEFESKKKKKLCSKQCKDRYIGFKNSRPAKTATCETCGEEFSYKGVQERRFCGQKCANKWVASLNAVELKTLTCPVCGESFKQNFWKQKFCSQECSHKGRDSKHSRIERLLMSIECMLRGGVNATPSAPQKLLAEALGEEFELEVVIPTRATQEEWKSGELPRYFKLDIANERAMIAIEIDGGSHKDREDYDAKRDSFLGQLGWTVFRFTNQEVMSSLDTVVEKIKSRCMT